MKQKTILLGEDEKDIAEMYKIVLAKNGFKTIIAENGEEVIKKIKESVPDLLLLDINMPVKDGFEVLQIIATDRSLSSMRGVPIIMLTNYNNVQDIEYCVKMGASDFIVKSEWTPETVFQKIKKYLDEA
ncbi:MAG: DNA-binding response regulator MtrA [Parcubacteria group bacterium ADurb.Bin316]|nr:MAG: DNA-binding response regulator MtrA [Parcubacteria group bacterium ADurb.Bin316]HOZ56167.1 response regulator [bacterium]